MRVLVVGEGPHEACALPVLVRRLQPATTETPFDFVKNGRRVHGKGRGMFKKAVGWMLDAQSLQYDALVFLTDEDGDRSRRRIILDRTSWVGYIGSSRTTLWFRKCIARPLVGGRSAYTMRQAAYSGFADSRLNAETDEHGMKRNLDKWSLVVVGQWNTAILSPAWLAKEFFHEKEVRIMYPVLGGGQPIFEAANIQVIVSRERLQLRPLKDDPELLRRIESGARDMLNILPHTPVIALGENFHYLVGEVPKKLQEALSFADADDIEQHGRISEVSLRRSIDLEDRRLNLNVTQSDQWKIDLNYHYTVPEDKEPGAKAAKLLENTFAPNRDHGLKLLETIYDLVLEEGTAA